MNEEVKPRRRYHSTRRATAASETRQAILDSAAALFFSEGWAASTIALIARHAGVSAETVYSVFGTKRAVMQELVQRAVRGAAGDVPLLEQAGPRSMMREQDPERQIELFAHDISAVLERVAPLMAAVQAGAQSDPDLANLYRQFHEGRRRNLAALADSLAGRGALREEVTRDDALGIVWRLASPEQFVLAIRVERLSLSTYETWLAASLKRMLLP